MTFSRFTSASPGTGQVRLKLVPSLEPTLPLSSVTGNVILGADQIISFPESSGFLLACERLERL